MSVRPARTDDLEAMLLLKAQVFGSDLEASRRRWEWQFDRNPACADDWTRALVIEDEAGVAGYFAFVPIVIELDGVRGTAADGVDLCLHPRLRGRGLGRALVEPLWEEGFCDFPFATGLNAASRHLFQAFGGTVIGGPAETAGYAYFVHDAHPHRPEGSDTEVVESFGDDADELWRGIRGHWKLALQRDARYLNWRYRDAPFEPCVLVRIPGGGPAARGIAVLQGDPALNRAYLLELLADPDDDAALGGLLAHAVSWADARGCEALYFGTRDARLAPALAGADFRPVPGDVPSFVGKLHAPSLRRGLEVRDWAVSLGDGDQLYSTGEPHT